MAAPSADSRVSALNIGDTKLVCTFNGLEDEVAMLGYVIYLWDNPDNDITGSRSASSHSSPFWSPCRP